MTTNFLVNGQTFKNFLLNLTACAMCAWDPVSFDPDAFYKQWTTRYFGENVSADAVKILKLTYDANQPIGGFRNTMNTSVQLLNKIERKEYEHVSTGKVDSSLMPAEQAMKLSKQLLSKVNADKRLSYIDQVAHPSEIFYLDLKFLQSVVLLNNALTDKSDKAIIQQKATAMRNALVVLRNKLTAGSGWAKWKDFYKPENFRIHTPPPTIEMVDKMIERF
jgi:hypothetical protein